MEATTAAEERTRPTRAEIDPAALRLIARHGPQILASARRWSLTPDDAEDAYQRGLEILLTKAPSTADDDLVPWLRTVVKHEAFAIRRQRERATPTAPDPDLVMERAAGPAPSTDEQFERLERLRHGAEALARLKPQEVRALLLRAEGYSYKQICEITGWTYTKVNRCVTEGRASFLRRLGDIQTGAECDRLEAKLSALADGEAGPAELADLRPHLRSCLVCRARLRDFRAAPGQLAALLPAPLVAADGAPGRIARLIESVQAAISDRVAAVSVKAQQAVELASAQKVAAVAASTAVIAGGGAATVRSVEGSEPSKPSAGRSVDRAPAAGGPAAPRADAVARVHSPARAGEERRARLERRRAARRERQAAQAGEFDPTAAAPSGGEPAQGAAPTAAQAPPEQPATDPAAAEFTP